MTALIAGSMVPDIPLFMGWHAGYEVTHSLVGVLVLDVGLTVGVLVVWFLAVRDAVVDLAPESARLRLPVRARLTVRQWVLTPLGACIGAATHVLWDEFTHPGRWGSRHVAWLSAEHAGLPGLRWLQYASGLLGLVVVLWAAARHLESLVPVATARPPAVLPGFVLPGVLALAALAGLISAGSETSSGLHAMAFVGVVNSLIAVVALGALACAAWQLARRRRESHLVTTRNPTDRDRGGFARPHAR